MLGNHLLQMIFSREFYDENHHVKKKHNWIWYVHIVSYSYIIFRYFFTDDANIDESVSSKMWIPLDILLFICIFLYYYIYKKIDDFNQ